MCFNGNCHDNICTTYGSCVGLLSTQVFVIMVSRVLLGNVSESKGVIRSLFQQCCCGSCCKKKQTKSLAEQHGSLGHQHAGLVDIDHLCDPEVEFFKRDYTIESKIYDYMEIVLEYGYLAFFGACWPLAPAVALLNNYIEARLDASKLSIECRRVFPFGAEDIGAFDNILLFMGYAALFVNAAIICVHGHFEYWSDDETSIWVRFGFFVVMEHSLVALRFLAARFVQPVPADVKLQLARNEHIVEKIIRNEPDEVEQPKGKGATDTLRAPRAADGKFVVAEDYTRAAVPALQPQPEERERQLQRAPEAGRGEDTKQGDKDTTVMVRNPIGVFHDVDDEL